MCFFIFIMKNMATSIKVLVFHYFILIHLVFTSISQPNLGDWGCSDRGNYTANSVYKNNLDNVLSSVSSDTKVDYGFYNMSFGQEPDKVYAIALCRGDLAVDKCRSCVNDATRQILQVCPNQMGAVGWYDECLIRYSNETIFGVREDGVIRIRRTSQQPTDVNVFNLGLRSLLDQLRIEAKSGTSIRKFATGEHGLEAPSFDTIYGMVQCSPDLSNIDCDGCLSGLASYIPGCCNASSNVRIYTPSCVLQYETSLFYNPPPPPPPPPTSLPPPPPPPLQPPLQGDDRDTARMIIIIVVPIVSIVVVITAICIFMRMRKKKYKGKRSLNRMESVSLQEETDEISSVETLQFEFDIVRTATDDFSSENKLGQGGFGAVYKGKLPNGQNIAVKRLAKNSQQGDVEFRNEVLLVAKLQHKNLVRLLGFCIQRNERLLFYEFLSNGSLERFIFDRSKRILLDWNKRYKIIVGIARGLLYLHEDSQLRIIHRDLKASNILLDLEMNPKIADFGLARLFELDESRGQTSRVAGTYGYMAPEYVMKGQYSTKSDVFSFGILVLEIIAGKKNHDSHRAENEDHLLSFVWKKWKEGKSIEIIDPTLNKESKIEMMRCIHIGLLCVEENVAARPTIASVLLMLTSNSLSLPLPSKPAFLMFSTGLDKSANRTHFKTKPSQYSEIEASITDLYPR